ncbi:hypothetical protein KSZ_42600 [Dictyobacter formicarum]|uniref:Nudix hydrolase domain-containing protein n=1 Tax=Dictyobacter formicarum TaxID=2778368 RepID=A0ABQ3VKP1_9CHLR|nr:hypothetical protein KSZ_42600 [Dictyobacter formicarum]
MKNDYLSQNSHEINIFMYTRKHSESQGIAHVELPGCWAVALAGWRLDEKGSDM